MASECGLTQAAYNSQNLKVCKYGGKDSPVTKKDSSPFTPKDFMKRSRETRSQFLSVTPPPKPSPQTHMSRGKRMAASGIITLGQSRHASTSKLNHIDNPVTCFAPPNHSNSPKTYGNPSRQRNMSSESSPGELTTFKNPSITVTPISAPAAARSLNLGPGNSVEVEPVITGSVFKNKRAPLLPIARAIKKSSILSDFSPSKVEKTYAPQGSSSPSEKENVTPDAVKSCLSPEIIEIDPHRLGFPNLGNTCYLNAVLQSLVNLRVFRIGLSECVDTLSPNEDSLVHALSRVLSARSKGAAWPLRDSLRSFKNNFESIDSSFLGWKMQDANEFLTKVLDRIKDEIDNFQKEAAKASLSPLSLLKMNNSNSKGDVYCVWNNSVVISHVPTSSSDPPTNKAVKRLYSETQADDDTDIMLPKKLTKSKYSGSTLSEDGEERSLLKSNPINDNFGFKLCEAYKCLQCSSVIKKIQEYFSLYVHLAPMEENTDLSTSIREAVEGYMKVDYRDLKCEKCGHEKVEVSTTFASMPRVLIIQVKRYMFSNASTMKIQSCVRINKHLNLSGFTNEESEPYPPHVGSGTKSTPTTPFKEDRGNTPRSQKKIRFEAGPPLESASTSEAGGEAEKELTEDEQIQEAMRRSLQDSPPQTVPDDAEDELERVLQLSLQEAQIKRREQINMDVEDSPANNNEEADAPAAGGEAEEAFDSVNDEAECVDDITGDHVYSLASIVSHIGYNTESGHYVSDVYSNEAGGWLNYDDDAVSDISESIVVGSTRQKNGYILFYVHKDLLSSDGVCSDS